jgi:hypothetical protein
MQNFIYEGISFNVKWVKTKTEKEFIAHEKHHFKTKVEAENKLKEVYNLIIKIQ